MTAQTRLATLVLISALTGCSPVSGPPRPAPVAAAPTLQSRDCISESSTTSWVPQDDHTILVRSVGRAVRVTTSRCPRLRDPLVQLTRVMRGSSRICSPHDVQLYVSDSANTAPIPCFIQKLEPLSEAEATAIERSARR